MIRKTNHNKFLNIYKDKYFPPIHQQVKISSENLKLIANIGCSNNSNYTIYHPRRKTDKKVKFHKYKHIKARTEERRKSPKTHFYHKSRLRPRDDIFLYL